MTDLPTARQKVLMYLQRIEADMNAFGSTLPGYKNQPKCHLVIIMEREYEFGWIFGYTSKDFVDSGGESGHLAGNAPIICDRNDGRLYVTGTGRPLDYYVEQYRKGVRHPCG